MESPLWSRTCFRANNKDINNNNNNSIIKIKIRILKLDLGENKPYSSWMNCNSVQAPKYFYYKIFDFIIGIILNNIDYKLVLMLICVGLLFFNGNSQIVAMNLITSNWNKQLFNINANRTKF